jgi:hypothetical protein
MIKPRLLLMQTADLQHYLFCSSLGRLVAGDYSLELFDMDSARVALSRRCEITVE